MSSVAGRTYTPIVACHYAATKGALIGFTRPITGELGPYGMRVNALSPGRIATPLVRTVPEEENDEAVRMTPLGRLGEAGEVADAALRMTGERSSFVTGQTIDVAGAAFS